MLKRGVHPLYRTCPSTSWAPSRHWGGVYCAAHQTGAHTSRPLLVLPRSAAQSGDAPLCLASPAALVRHFQACGDAPGFQTEAEHAPVTTGGATD